jgi:hypothetical protein
MTSITPNGSVDVLKRRIQSEFLEMPGLRLTSHQACRLLGLEADVCEPLLESLVEARFLRRTQSGAFMRIDGRDDATDRSPAIHR